MRTVFAYASDWRSRAEWFEGVSDFRPTTQVKEAGMVAWVDTFAGRSRVALLAAVVVLVGGFVYALGAVVWSPLLWGGRVIVGLGVLFIIWAFLHPTRSGLPALPRSEACRAGRHDQCPLASAAARPGGCACQCHQPTTGLGGRTNGTPPPVS